MYLYHPRMHRQYITVQGPGVCREQHSHGQSRGSQNLQITLLFKSSYPVTIQMPPPPLPIICPVQEIFSQSYIDGLYRSWTPAAPAVLLLGRFRFLRWRLGLFGIIGSAALVADTRALPCSWSRRFLLFLGSLWFGVTLLGCRFLSAVCFRLVFLLLLLPVFLLLGLFYFLFLFSLRFVLRSALLWLVLRARRGLVSSSLGFVFLREFCSLVLRSATEHTKVPIMVLVSR